MATTTSTTGQTELRLPLTCCPRCGSRPALRVTDFLAERLHGADPRWTVGTVRCQRRGCGTIYPLTVAALRSAR